MTSAEVMRALEKNRNERGIASFNKMGAKKLRSFGIGLTQLRKLAKKVGRDHDLAQELWKSNVYDAKVIGVLIDEPKKITRKQAESQVQELGFWMFSHIYCSCDAPLSRSPIARELAEEWMDAKDPVRRRCGYLLLGELAKDTRDDVLPDAFLEARIERMAESIRREENFVKDAMNGSLFWIGQRNARLHRKALAAARAIGKIEVDYGDNRCVAIDVVKHLSSERIRAKVK